MIRIKDKLYISSHGFKIRKFKVILNDKDIFVMNIFGMGIIYNKSIKV